MNSNLFDDLKTTGAQGNVFKGDIDYSNEILSTYSHDASLFEIRPRVVVFPKDSADVQTLVKWVNAHQTTTLQKNNAGIAVPTSDLSITARSAGTDMSGGSINASIIVDFTRYMNAIGKVTSDYGTVQPGCYYRNFEKETLRHSAIMPTYPASREICAVGGMVGNNSGGEKSLKYGKTAAHVHELNVVFTDGNEYTVRPLTASELATKAAQNDFEGAIYKQLSDLINKNADVIMAAKPTVSKNSAGYYLWNVYDKKTGIFDLCQLIVGSQGTLGLVTQITFKLVPVEPFSNMLVVFLPELSHLSELINEILPSGPDSVESYDDASMKLAIKFSFDFFRQLGFMGAMKLGLQFIPDAWAVLVSRRIPKLIIMVEFEGKSEVEIKQKLVALKAKIAHFGYKIHIARSGAEANKYWKIRRESFNLLRKHTKGKKTAPFIDDIIVAPEALPVFIPKIQTLLDEYKLIYTIAGHPGNGNFHIIPLMDLASPLSGDVILELSKKVYDLVHEYHGSITAEHNDGIIRTPYLLQMYGENIIKLFKATKEIFDPRYILNPGKKVGGTFEDIRKYISK
ncbi:MAG: FAD-binding oxidoreductase [bacterium]